MDTTKEKIDALLEQIIYCDLRTDIGTDKAKKAIRLSLKEQDRDTRHACAEAIAFVNDNDEHDVVIGNAIRACMNVKAVQP